MSTLQELKDLLLDEPFTFDLPSEDWSVVEDCDWEDEGKYQSASAVIAHKSGKIFMVTFTRYGSHWSGYETEFEDAWEVEAYEKTITAYRRVDVSSPPNVEAEPVGVRGVREDVL